MRRARHVAWTPNDTFHCYIFNSYKCIYDKRYRPKMHIKVVSWGVLLALGGCASVKTPVQTPLPLNVPAVWSQANAPATLANTSLVHWWWRFDAPLLGSLVNRALLANTSIQGAQAALQQARAVRDVTAAGLVPSLGTSATAQRNRNGDNTGNSFQVGLDASWEMDVFGANRHALSASDADRKSVV